MALGPSWSPLGAVWGASAAVMGPAWRPSGRCGGVGNAKRRTANSNPKDMTDVRLFGRSWTS
eukprot:7881390-Pyramimonas_sp.AAC.1